jgi:uncharacterized membrane protein YccC
MRLVFGCVCSLLGVFCLAQQYREGLIISLLAIQVAGLAAGGAIALWALIQRTTRRWPAAAVLVCAAPMAQLVLQPAVLVDLSRLDKSAILMVLGSLITVVGAVIVLVAKTPPEPRDSVAPAVARSRSSE